MKNTPLIIIFSLFFVFNASAQDYPYTKFPYKYIRNDKNKITFPGDSTNFEIFYNKLDTLILKGKGKINIIHIGGSHIQAGIYSGRTRERLQTFYPGLNGGRGLVFPYRMSRSNSPNNYNFTWSGIWQTARNVEYRKSRPLGMLGIQAYTDDSQASLEIVLGENYLKYDINSIRIFTEFGLKYYKIRPKGIDSSKYSIEYFEKESYLKINYKQYIDTVKLEIVKTDSLQNEFVLYGISLDNDDPGIVYHDTGINGASIPSFLRCNLFSKQMKIIEPDLVIISLGTNDTYTRTFSPSYYKENYKNILYEIKKAAPNAAILMTVPNDSYYRRKYPNKNVSEAEKVILSLAGEKGAGVWDFYQIMGGFNSSMLWYNDLLMAYDRIHFTNSGYLIKGDLLFYAILKSYDNHIEKKNKSFLP